MERANSTRRDFLLRMGGTASAAWINAQWPAMLAAAQHARQAVQSKYHQSFEVLTLEQAREVEAMASCIIPTDDLPGAREAGVVYFIDHALNTFASDARPMYERGLISLNKLTGELFPGVERFSAATPEQQEKILSELAGKAESQRKPIGRRLNVAPADFFQTVWLHTVWGFLVDPEGGGNLGYAGWKVIGRDPAHSFSPPFGYYDKDYPGWRTISSESEEK
jgi:gluconate 2-dehydrogenase gamma chain